MNITSIGSPQWLTIKYKANTGGVDVKNLQKLTDKDQPQDAVKVTISKEAKELYNAMIEAQEK